MSYQSLQSRHSDGNEENGGCFMRFAFSPINYDVETWQLWWTAHRRRIRRLLSSALWCSRLGRCSNWTPPLRAGPSACRRAHRQPGLFIGQWGRRDSVVGRHLLSATCQETSTVCGGGYAASSVVWSQCWQSSIVGTAAVANRRHGAAERCWCPAER